MPKQKRSLLGAYLQGLLDIGVWLVPAIVSSLVVVLAQRTFLPTATVVVLPREDEK